MTQVFQENGTKVPVTVIELGPVVVTQIKTEENDGYNAIQIGFQEIKEGKQQKLPKALKGHFKEQTPTKFLKEIRVEDPSQFEIGQKFDVNVFSKDQFVDVAGTSKGRGFAGSIKRHGFGGGPGSHGHRAHRVPGSIGQSATPGRVFKGKKMPGHYGNERVTVQGLQIVDVKPELNAILVKGCIPGPNGRFVEVHPTKIKRKQKTA